MATSIITAGFDYDELGIASRDAKDLEKHAVKIDGIQATMRKANVDATMAIGEELTIAQHRLANYSRGTFVRWIKDRCGFATATAYKILAVYREFSERAGFPQCGKHIDVSALYLLASDKLPDDVVEGFIEKAAGGEKVSHKDVKAVMPKPQPRDTDPGAEPPRVVVDAASAEADRAGVSSDDKPVDRIALVARLQEEAFVKYVHAIGDDAIWSCWLAGQEKFNLLHETT